MKKFYLIIIVTFFISTTSTSQNVVYGVKAGMNLSKFSGSTNDPYSGYDGKVGFHLGGIIEISLTEMFSIQPELLYSYQGTNINSGAGRIGTHNVQVPVLGKYYILDGLSAEAGPVMEYLASAKYNATLTSEGGRETIDITDNYKSLNFAFGFGASYKLISDLFFGIRYNFGISNINDADLKDSKTKSNVLQLSAGYFF
ncbi:porin family protein [Aequorivita capsosiphonis]|uniref:porin family protein n=1 Tax=Aequorivita capsosiphonis TaxID=487317 RepID=UPI00040FD44E|nr:porin family protein [Aequorivita capsosiphonis]